MKEFAELFHKELFDAADRGIYPGRFTDKIGKKAPSSIGRR